MAVKKLLVLLVPYSFCKQRAIRCRYFLYVLLLILCPVAVRGDTGALLTADAPLSTARSSAGSGASVLGTRLGDSAAAVLAAHPQSRVEEWRNGKGVLMGQRLVTRQGYADGGFFQVLLTRKELGGVVWSVTRNIRTHVAGQSPEVLLEAYVAEYGPYELLCTQRFTEHAVYHVYWLNAPDDCSVAGGRPEKPYLYLNLVTGKWTEELLMLVDPALGRANGNSAE